MLVELGGGSLRGTLLKSLAHRRLLEGEDFEINPMGVTAWLSQTLLIPLDIKCHSFGENNRGLHPDAYNLPISKHILQLTLLSRTSEHSFK